MAADLGRRFANRSWACRLPGWRLVLSVLAAGALSAAAVWALFFSTLLSVTDIRVDGAARLTPAHVKRVAAVPIGEPLARLDLDGIAARVAAVPAVRTVSVERHWPHTLAITVTERVPLVLVGAGHGRRGVDASGTTFRLARGEQQALPRLIVDRNAAPGLLSEAARVIAALPMKLAGRVEEVHAATPDSITLYLRSGEEVRWGSAARSAEKARVLGVLLRRPAAVYDVSVPHQPTTATG